MTAPGARQNLGVNGTAERIFDSSNPKYICRNDAGLKEALQLLRLTFKKAGIRKEPVLLIDVIYKEQFIKNLPPYVVESYNRARRNPAPNGTPPWTENEVFRLFGIRILIDSASAQPPEMPL